jgi:phosphate starvation-inducible PhoH-like protein
MSQTDLPRGQKSGLAIASSILQDIPEIRIFSFTSRDVVRHPLVRKIIDAYEKYDKGIAAKKEREQK